MTGRAARVLHTFFALRDGSFIAFFEAPDAPFDFKRQHDFDLHMALESDPEEVVRVTAEARARGLRSAVHRTTALSPPPTSAIRMAMSWSWR